MSHPPCKGDGLSLEYTLQGSEALELRRVLLTAHVCPHSCTRANQIWLAVALLSSTPLTTGCTVTGAAKRHLHVPV